MRDVAEEVKLPVTTLVGAFLVVWGVLLITPLIVMLPIVPFMCLFLWLPILGCLGYIILGVGLIKRRSWAYFGAKIFMVLVIILLVGAMIFFANSLSWALLVPMIIIHVAIFYILGEHRLEPRWDMRRRIRKVETLRTEEISGLTCEKCGSGNLAVYPDGSGICRDCRHVFSDAMKRNVED